MSECVVWTGARRADGYGTVGAHGLAHREAWRETRGEIPSGLVVHHECGNPSCVNVEHMSLMPQADHARLHDHITTAQRVARDLKRAATHCKHGHEFTEVNTYWTRSGRRNCRACHALNERARRRAA